MKNLGIASVLLSKPGVGSTAYTQTQHYRSDVASEEEMIGHAMKKAIELKPGFAIETVIVQIVKLDAAEAVEFVGDGL